MSKKIERIILSKNYFKIVKQVLRMALDKITPIDKNLEVIENMEETLKEMDYMDKNCVVAKGGSK